MSAYVSGSARHCQNKKFWNFLSSKTGVPVCDAAAAAESLRHICGIQSRRELSTNQRARTQYVGLIKDFNDFLKGGVNER
ncbi:MAG: hypothetical protein ACEQSN_15030 [Yersinia sp. (in: enterobacteria)]|jgi:hypothetical protein